MATNKRKDAAALFELIDKSTLKVPKGAGALKIPNWWSSKHNPHATDAETTDTPETNGHAAPVAPPRSVPQVRKISAPVLEANPAENSPGVAEPAEQTPPAQHRLFDPPPASAVPAKSPSIRPPAPAAAVVPPVIAAAPAAEPAASLPPVEVVPPKPTEVVAERKTAEPPAVAVARPPAAPRVFAPQTYAQHNRAPWPKPRAGSLARVPRSVLMVAGLVVVGLVVGVVLLFRGGGKSQNTTTNPPPHSPLVTLPGGDSHQNSLVPPAKNPLPQNTGPQNSGPEKASKPVPLPNKASSADLPPASYTGTGGGHVWRPTELAAYRSPDRYYVVVATTSEAEVAQRNAILIADNGVDVSIEVTTKDNKKLYTIISAEGFDTVTKAQPLRNTIVQIGKNTAEYKKTGKAWNDAYIFKVVPKTATKKP